MSCRKEVTIIQIGSSGESEEEIPTTPVEYMGSIPAHCGTSGLRQRARSNAKTISMSTSEAESGSRSTSEGSGSSAGLSNDVIIPAVKEIVRCVDKNAEVIANTLTNTAAIITTSVQQSVTGTAVIISRDVRRILALGLGVFLACWLSVNHHYIILAACGFNPLLTLFVIIGICIVIPYLILLLNDRFTG